MGARREARRLAVLALYQADVLGERLDERADRLCAEEGASAAQAAYVARIVELFGHHRAVVDRVLREAGASWELERMAATDRAVLRVAAVELFFLPEIPEPVTLDEAIEIAKDYGGEQSGGFVNGVLDAVRRRLQEDAAAAGAAPDESAGEAGLVIEDDPPGAAAAAAPPADEPTGDA